MAEDPNPFEGMSISEIIKQEVDNEFSREVRRYILHTAEQRASSSRRRPSKGSYIDSNREAGEVRLMNDYYSDQPVYNDYQFCRRFRMRKHVFQRIVNELENRFPYFQRRVDAVGRNSLSAIRKCTAAIRMLAYGGPADVFDEYLRIGESTTIECTRKFVQGVREIFGPYYLKKHDANDTAYLLRLGNDRGFPGMLGSVDCMHWAWRNCPFAWKGMYSGGGHGVPTIMLEAGASQDLWIWHAFFGVAGSNNDLNVFNQSELFIRNLQGQAPNVDFEVNDRHYNVGYYLADGIYPQWSTFVKTIPLPLGEKGDIVRPTPRRSSKSCRASIYRPTILFCNCTCTNVGTLTLSDIMYACIILHNMIVEDERHRYDGDFVYEINNGQTESTNEINSGPLPNFSDILETNASLRNRQIHRQLQEDLVEHIWKKFGDDNE